MFLKNLKALRKANNETQLEMAERLEVTQRTIANWEAGDRNPDFQMLARIAKTYGVTTDYLLGLTDDPQFEQPATIAARPTEGMPPISQERLDEIIAEAVHEIRKAAGYDQPQPKKKEDSPP